MAIEEQTEIRPRASILVMPKLAEKSAAPPQSGGADPGRKLGVLITWPSQVSATLRRVKAAITPVGNTEVLKLFESANRP